MNGLRWTLLAVIGYSVAAGHAWAGGPGPDMAREDWYLRESLAAIRDWEDILACWEKTVPEAERTPVLPVPADGQAVPWPNPIPRMLLPAKDRDAAVRVRFVGGKIEVERTDGGGQSTRDSAGAGAEVLGYKHFGGGGKDQWYHRYFRKFDRLTTFRPKPAPVALTIDGPLDLRRGNNELGFSLRNCGADPLVLAVELDFHSPKGSRPCLRRSIALAPGAGQAVRLPVVIDAPGGGLLILRVVAGKEAWWLPVLTHAEDVAPVLESIAQILADTPDAQAAARLAGLRQGVETWRPAAGDSGRRWSSLFEEASRLRDELLLGRLRFGSLLFLKRKPFISEQPFMDAHHLMNRPGGGIYRLEPPRPFGTVTPVVDSLGEGVYRDLCLHWDARRFLFAFGNGSDSWDGGPSYHVYEANVDGSGLRQLTRGPKNDCEPIYLPNGQIGFTSDRSEHFVMCGGDRHSPTLFAMGADGSGVRQLSFNVFNDFTPSVLPDGRILYGRWEYNERSVTSLHNPFTMNPDGTMVAPYYGNATIRPNVIMFPRPVPGSHKVMALFTAHHGQTHGAVGLIDARRGIDGPAPLTVLTPGVPITGHEAEDSRGGWFSDPMPLSETTWLCSYTPTLLPWLEWTWAIYVADRHGNLALVYRDPTISCAEPVPLVARPRPHVVPPRGADAPGADRAEATLMVADVYAGLDGVPRGEARYLRILEDVPRKGVHHGGVVCTSGTQIFTIKRVLGTVPVEPDGSAHFTVPADRNVYFEVLDEKHREMQRMRSVVCLRPGETRACVGCHEPRNATPPATVDRAVRRALDRAPSRPVPPPWGTQIVSFLRDVQPVLNAKCVACHTHDRQTNRVILTDDLTDQFTIGYEELLPYLSVANAMRWDHPEDVYARPPYTYGSKVSRLTRLLEAGHYGVTLNDDQGQRLLNWIDANGVYYDTYETNYWPNRRIFSKFAPEALEVIGRRCVSCHGRGDGRFDTWIVSLNWRDVRLSRALAAPLARSAGGWGRCDQTVFADTNDPDYRTLLGALGSLRETLAKHPREDLLSIRGTEAERQVVTLPPPPVPTPRRPELPEGDWVFLSDLAWESGRSGWSPNRDGLPRLDKDIEDSPLRLAGRRHRRGVGTHAPSEIVYPLDGKFLRFFSVVGAAERGGTVVFQVFGDDSLLFDSGLMQGLNGARTVDVSVAGVRRLRLVVTDAGDGYHADMANWADARLLKAPGAGK